MAPQLSPARPHPPAEVRPRSPSRSPGWRSRPVVWTVVRDLDLVLAAGDKVGVVGRWGRQDVHPACARRGAAPGGRDGAAPGRRRIPPASAATPSRRWHDRDRVPPRGPRADRAPAEREKARLLLEELASEEHVARFARLQDDYERVGGYRGGGSPRDRRGPRPRPGPAPPARGRVVRRRAAAAGAGQDPLRRLGPAAAGRAHEPPRRGREGMADALPLGYRGALLVVSHDIALLDASITRILHLDRDGVVEYRGTYTAYREARAADEVRLAALATRQEAEIKRLKTLADSMRGRRRSGLARRRRRHAWRACKRARSPPRGTNERCGSGPGSAPLGPDAARRRGPHEGVRGPAGVRGDSFDVERGERLLVMGLNGAGRRACSGSSPTRRGRTPAPTGSVTARSSATTHRSTRASATACRCSRTCTRPPAPTIRRSAPCSACSASTARWRSRTPARSGGEKTKLALAQLVAGRKNLLLLDEPTNNLDPRRGRRSRTPSATGRGDGDRATTPSSWKRLPRTGPRCRRAAATTGATTCWISSRSRDGGGGRSSADDFGRPRVRRRRRVHGRRRPSRAQAVAVKDGRIVAVGSDDDVRPLLDARTEVVDLGGRMLPRVPGRARPSRERRARHAPVRPPRPPYGRGVPPPRARLRGRAPRSRVDPRGRLVDGPVPGRHPDEGPARFDRAGATRLSPEPTGTAAG